MFSYIQYYIGHEKAHLETRYTHKHTHNIYIYIDIDIDIAVATWAQVGIALLIDGVRKIILGATMPQEWGAECKKRQYNKFTTTAWIDWVMSLKAEGFGRYDKQEWNQFVEEMQMIHGPSTKASPGTAYHTHAIWDEPEH